MESSLLFFTDLCKVCRILELVQMDYTLILLCPCNCMESTLMLLQIGTPTLTCYRKHEKAKKRSYEQKLNILPSHRSSTGGLGPAATATYKRLATLLAAKWNQPYSSTMSWLRCRLIFTTQVFYPGHQRCPVHCGQSVKVYHPPPPPIDLVMEESKVTE